MEILGNIETQIPHLKERYKNLDELLQEMIANDKRIQQKPNFEHRHITAEKFQTASTNQCVPIEIKATYGTPTQNLTSNFNAIYQESISTAYSIPNFQTFERKTNEIFHMQIPNISEPQSKQLPGAELLLQRLSPFLVQRNSPLKLSFDNSNMNVKRNSSGHEEEYMDFGDEYMIKKKFQE